MEALKEIMFANVYAEFLQAFDTDKQIRCCINQNDPRSGNSFHAAILDDHKLKLFARTAGSRPGYSRTFEIFFSKR